MKQFQLLLKCAEMIRESKVCPETNPSDWPRILMFAHLKGYLYTNRDCSAFVMAYRIPEWDEKWSVIMPGKEHGNVLFVAWAVSKADNKLGLLKMLRTYLMQNPDIEQVVYYRRNSNTDFKCLNLRRNKNEQTESSKFTVSA